VYAGLIGLVYLGFWGYSTFAGRAPLTRNGETIPGDFMAFYTAGRMLLDGEGRHLYDPVRVRELEAKALQSQVPDFYDPFRNPPFFAVPFAPLGLLDLMPSFVVWSLFNIACLGYAMWLAIRMLPGLRSHWRAIGVIGLSFLPVYRGLVGGQSIGLSLLLYVLIYRAMNKGRAPAAGLWAALGLFKPQLFVVFPIVFVASRRWRALGTYCAVGVVLMIVSLAIVGVEGVWEWARQILDNEAGNALKNAYRMHSLKAFFDLLLPAQSGLGLALYGAGSALLLVPLVRVWSVAEAWRDHLALRWALTSVVAVLVDPHLVDYDLVILLLTGLLIGATVPYGQWWLLGVYVALVGTLLFDVVLPFGGQLQITVLAFVGFVAWSWYRLEQLSAPAPDPTAAARYATVPQPRL
jgi:hypothetical protein